MNLSSPSAVSALLKRHNLHPRRRFGQNFLVDANTLGRIVAAGGLSPGDQVLEIGAGLGVLTEALAGAVTPGGRVVTVEVDTALLPALSETVGGIPQVRVVCSDAMEIDWPLFLDENFGSGPISVVANIPYNITSPLIAALIEHKERFRSLVLLVQKEVAVRLASHPGSADWGAFSVFVQYHTMTEIVATVSRRVFYPAPDVDSAVVRLVPRERPPVDVSDESLFFAVVRASFGQRRKSLINSLSGDPKLSWDRERASNVLAAAGIDLVRRGETLTPAEFARIANASPADQ